MFLIALQWAVQELQGLIIAS